MDWRVFLTAFGIIFLAEMGDKTQIAAMTMGPPRSRQLAFLWVQYWANTCRSNGSSGPPALPLS